MLEPDRIAAANSIDLAKVDDSYANIARLMEAGDADSDRQIQQGYRDIAADIEAGDDVVQDVVGDGILDGDTSHENGSSSDNVNIREAIEDYKKHDVNGKNKSPHYFNKKMEYGGMAPPPSYSSRIGRGKRNMM